MKRQRSFKNDELNNNEKIISANSKNLQNNSISNNSQLNPDTDNPIQIQTDSNTVKTLNQSNSGTELSAMEKHRLKMKERRSVDKQIKLENGTLNKHESKDQKLNEDINAVLG